MQGFLFLIVILDLQIIGVFVCVCICRGLHLSVIHSQTDSVKNLAGVIAAIPGEDVMNMRNDLYQVHTHKLV